MPICLGKRVHAASVWVQEKGTVLAHLSCPLRGKPIDCGWTKLLIDEMENSRMQAPLVLGSLMAELICYCIAMSWQKLGCEAHVRSVRQVEYGSEYAVAFNGTASHAVDVRAHGHIVCENLHTLSSEVGQHGLEGEPHCSQLSGVGMLKPVHVPTA